MMPGTVGGMAGDRREIGMDETGMDGTGTIETGVAVTIGGSEDACGAKTGIGGLTCVKSIARTPTGFAESEGKPAVSNTVAW